jgi:hypothetical protein
MLRRFRTKFSWLVRQYHRSRVIPWVELSPSAETFGLKVMLSDTQRGFRVAPLAPFTIGPVYFCFGLRLGQFRKSGIFFIRIADRGATRFDHRRRAVRVG